MIPRMFHEENIVFLTCRSAVFRRKVGLTVVLRWSYGGLMIQVTEKHLELSTYEGTKNVRETSDMVRGLPTESTKDTKVKIYMKSESIEPQNTQKCAEIYNGSREGQEKSFCVFLRCLRLKKTT